MALVGDLGVIQYSTDNVTYTSFAYIEDWKGNKVTSAEVKLTKLGDAAERRQAGIPDYGDIELVIRFNKTITGTILGWQNNKTNLYLKASVNDGGTPFTYDSSTGLITGGNGSNEVIHGFVRSFDPFGTIKNNTEVVSTLTFAIDGAATWTAGS